MTIQHTPFENIERIYQSQQRNRAAIAASGADERIEKLKRLERAVRERRNEIYAAMWEDFRKPAAEVDLSEIYAVAGEARHAIRHLRRWMRPRKVSTPLALTGSSSSVMYQPKGVVLILAPWNFPFNLTLGPLVSAVAAGNCAILKPSELTPASTACIARIVSDLFPPEEVAVVSGGPEVAEALLAKKFDHIFFTGSPAIGKVVMKAAAEHLTSVTLELGGKSPAIVHESADLDDAAKKIAWGKFFNAGQTCIAPDYVLVDEKVHAKFSELLKQRIASLGSEGARGIIVNERHASRVGALLDEAIAGGARLLTGGTVRGRELEPTVIDGVPPGSAVMREEIFGPLLPIVGYRSIREAVEIVGSRENPLALYLFTRDRRVAEEVIRGTRAGGTAINQTLVHFYQLELPFGGAGHSGIGRAHGFAGFEAFSNPRGVLRQRLPYSAIEMLYPPYGGKLKQFLIDFTVRWL